MNDKEYQTMAIRVAANRKAIQTADDWRHWRIILESTGEELQVKSVLFYYQSWDQPLGMVSGTQKERDPRNMVVWFDAKGKLEIIDHIAKIDLDPTTSQALSFSVRSEYLKDRYRTKYWVTFLGDELAETDVFAIQFFFRGQPLPIITHGQKRLDPYGLMAWLKMIADIRVDDQMRAHICLK